MSISPLGLRPLAPDPRALATPKSGARQAVDQVVGFAGQVVGGLTAAVPGALVGGLYAAEWKLPKEERHSKELGALMYAGMSVASSMAQQAATGFILQSPGWGMSPTNWGTAVAGSAWQYCSGGSGDVAERIYQAIDKEVDLPADSTLRIGKGMLHGLVEGTKGGAHEGKMQGIGIVEGTLEGYRDGVQGLRGKWDGAETVPSHPVPAETALTRKIVEGTLGAVGGALGASLYAVDGAVQGGVRGILGRHALRNKPQFSLQAALAGAVGGAVLLGPLGAVGGLMIGKWAGDLVHRSESESLTRALEESLGNSPDLGDKQANTYRDTVEGVMVGCLVGARNGMKVGSRRARESASTLWEQFAEPTHNTEQGPEQL